MLKRVENSIIQNFCPQIILFSRVVNIWIILNKLLLTMPKPLTVWITINCGKFWKRWAYQTTWPASWKTRMQVRKQQLELDMEQQTGSTIVHGVVKTQTQLSDWANTLSYWKLIYWNTACWGQFGSSVTSLPYLHNGTCGLLSFSQRINSFLLWRNLHCESVCGRVVLSINEKGDQTLHFFISES